MSKLVDDKTAIEQSVRIQLQLVMIELWYSTFRLTAAISSDDFDLVRKYGSTSYLERPDVMDIFLQAVKKGKSEAVRVLLLGGFVPNLNSCQVN